MKPLVLVSNDDGILAPYLPTTVAALEDAGFEVIVVAPERQRSAASHAITLHKPLRLREHKPGWFFVSGTPVDCVYIGLLKVVDRKPTAVVSGINHGYNLGSDVFYSGTVAAAVEAGLRGVPGVAISVAPKSAEGATPERVDCAARFSASLLKNATEAGDWPDKMVLNINVPKDTDEYAWTHLGNRKYVDVVHEREDPRGEHYVWIGGGVRPSGDAIGSDCHATEAGYISVTPVDLDLTRQRSLEHGPRWAASAFRYRKDHPYQP